MGQHRRVKRGAVGLVVVSVALAAPGCRRRPLPEPPTSSLPPPPAEAPATPVDSTLPGEIAEGKERAFGLPIPRDMTVQASMPEGVLAIGWLPAEQVSNYVRARVTAGHVDTGPAKTVFADVLVKGDPSRVLRVEVILRGSRTELFVHDETHPAAKEGLTPEERWRELGFKPDGTPLDPTRLE